MGNSKKNKLLSPAPGAGSGTGSGTGSDPVSAKTATEQEVEFINAEVLSPNVTPMIGSSKPLADQAAAMMIQDTQSFLQSNEQVLTIAIAKAAAMMLSPDPLTAEAGQNALNAYSIFLTSLATYSGTVGATATTIAANFQG